MNTNLSSSTPSQVETECLVVVTLDRNGKDKDKSKDKEKTAPTVETSDAAVRDAAKDVIASGEVTGKALEITLLHNPTGLKAKRLLLIGGGSAKTFSSADLRKIAGTAVRTLKPKNVHNFALVAPETAIPAADAVRAVVEGAIIGDFDPGYYKSDRTNKDGNKDKKKEQKIDSVTIIVSGDTKSAESALQTGRIVAESQNFTRDLVNEPSNRMTPTMMAERAKKMAAEVGLACEAYGPDKIKELKMGAFWGVAQGSDEPPALIVLRYDPAGATKDVHLGLVGKGVTFDTGGISIKPADGMEKMKYDMAGAATMMGAMRAIALLKPKVKVTAVICATENMPSGKAQKPGDVQIAMSGKSIEIINTDAEGRLILADGLAYARQLGCTHLVDAATLTGAVVVALGYINAGIFASTDEMYDRYAKALNQTDEKMWRLPLDDEYKDLLKSNIADMVNAGSRWGGAIFAAMFLKEFAEDTPWIHLDIAGTAWMEDNKPWIAKGPSGIALRSLVEFVKGWGA
ncbi:MAG TPA: leucyl aminopeptidase [Terriglobales bacterium]|nr:leucyl aminopeptidase [Terriglobales bacterium]